MSEREHEISPRSGRPKVAQRFIAGDEKPYFLVQVREADGRDKSRDQSPSFLPPVSRALVHFCRVPSTKVLGYCRPSAARTLLSL
jgi:hypothetical protein